jgi:hypothetical protein
LLPVNYTKDEDAYSTGWIRTDFYDNPEYANDDTYRALDKAVSKFQKRPQTNKFKCILPKWEKTNWYKTFIHHFEIVKGHAPPNSGFLPKKITNENTTQDS